MNANVDAIKAWVRAHRDQIIRSIQELIRIPTENRPPKGDEYAGQIYVKGILEGMGAEVDMFTPDEVPELLRHPAYYPGRDYADRPNVVGVFRGSGGGRSIGFSSHMDTASRDPLPWVISEPFSGEVKEDRLYGRGSYDMKAGLMASIWAVRAVRELGVPLRGDVIIESVVDEEWGGSNGTLAARLRGYNPDVFVIPEPSHMVVAPAHLGVRIYRLTLSGASGMRFGGEKFDNPALGAAVVLEEIQKFAAEHHGLSLPAIYAGGDPPPVDVMAVEGRGYGVPRSCSVDFFVHFFEDDTREPAPAAGAGASGQGAAGQGASVVGPGGAAPGAAGGAAPKASDKAKPLGAYTDAALEHLPASALAVEARVKRFVDELKRHPRLSSFEIELEPLSRFVEPSSMPADHPIVGLACDALRALGRDAVVRGAPFACDGYVFNRYSPSKGLILGPGGAAAHAADEYVLIDDVLDLVGTYACLIAEWAG